ncbi:hypothetical protein [Mesorhizobium sp. CAU 1732]|uniref:hypothetical protein n=1 Tax=Mesorhizobium sp. CAU 1732 TaxID=3140358 RepID=UPI003261BC65
MRPIPNSIIATSGSNSGTTGMSAFVGVAAAVAVVIAIVVGLVPAATPGPGDPALEVVADTTVQPIFAGQ